MIHFSSTRLLAVAGLFCVLSGAKIQASTIGSSWIGAGQGWSSATSWSPNGVPDSQTNPGNIYNVTIDNGSGPILDVNAEINSLSIGATTGQASGIGNINGNTLTVDQDLTNAGVIDIQNGSGLVVHGNLTNSSSGLIQLAVSGSTPNMINVGGTLTNSGELDLDLTGGSADTLKAGTLVSSAGGRLIIGSDATATATNELDLTGGTVTVFGKLNGLNLIRTFSGGTLDLVNQNASITPAFNSGALNIGPGGMLELDGTQLSVNGNVTSGGQITTVGAANNLANGPSSFNVSGTFTNSNQFFLVNSGDTASIGNLINSGWFGVGAGATANLTNQPAGITDVGAGTRFSVNGSFTAGNNSAFANLQSVEGELDLGGQQTLVSTPGSGTLTVGPFSVASASVQNGFVNFAGTNWTVAGNVENRGRLQATGSGFTATGSFNNEANAMFTVGGTATIGTLSNSGQIIVNSGATLNAANGFTDITGGAELDLLGTFNGGGTNALTNLSSVEGVLVLANGQTTTSTPSLGTLNLTGAAFVGSGATWTINGNLDSNANGFVNYTQTVGLTVNGTLNVAGDLNSTSIISLNGVINANTFESGGLQAGVSPPPGAAVHVAGAFTQNGGVTFLPNVNDFMASQMIINGGTFFANGFSTNTLDILSGAVLVQVGSIGAPIPAGINFNGNPQLTIAAGGTLIDNGSVQVGGVVTTFPPHTIPGSVNTAGTVTIGSTGSLSITGSYTQTAGITTVDGTLAASNVNINGGVLKGAGTIQGSPAGGVANVALSGATIQPSDPLSVTGNFSMDGQSTFLEDIFSGSNFGALDVSGTGDIAGTLDIALQNGFVPLNGERFVLLDAMGGLNGMFSAIEGSHFGPGNQDSWTISYANNEVTLTAQVVPAPEPAPLALVGLAFVSLGLLRGRLKRNN